MPFLCFRRPPPRYAHAAGWGSLHRRGARVRLRTERLAGVRLRMQRCFFVCLFLTLKYTQHNQNQNIRLICSCSVVETENVTESFLINHQFSVVDLYYPQTTTRGKHSPEFVQPERKPANLNWTLYNSHVIPHGGTADHYYCSNKAV